MTKKLFLSFSAVIIVIIIIVTILKFNINSDKKTDYKNSISSIQIPCKKLLKPNNPNDQKIKFSHWLELTDNEHLFAIQNASSKEDFLKMYFDSIKCKYKDQVKILTTPSIAGGLTNEKWSLEFDNVWNNIFNKNYSNIRPATKQETCENAYYVDILEKTVEKTFYFCLDFNKSNGVNNGFWQSDAWFLPSENL